MGKIKERYYDEIADLFKDDVELALDLEERRRERELEAARRAIAESINVMKEVVKRAGRGEIAEVGELK